MRTRTFLAVVTYLASVPLVSAFSNTSPFFLFSTVELPSSVENQRSYSVASSDRFAANVKKVIEACTSDAYIIVYQPGIHANDFSPRDSAPELRRRMEQRDQQILRVDHAVGTVDITVLKETAIKTCGAHEMTIDPRTGTFGVVEENFRPSFISLNFAKLSGDSSARAKQLSEHDVFLSALISTLPTTKYTVIYVSTPVDDADMIRFRPGQAQVRPHMSSPVASFEKRDFRIQASNNNSTGSLFTHYQFFTPAIFMSFIAIFILLALVFAAISAVSSIQVSYGSFEKEMAPAEQKKNR